MPNVLCCCPFYKTKVKTSSESGATRTSKKTQGKNITASDPWILQFHFLIFDPPLFVINVGHRSPIQSRARVFLKARKAGVAKAMRYINENQNEKEMVKQKPNEKDVSKSLSVHLNCSVAEMASWERMQPQCANVLEDKRTEREKQ